jgi:hypothetical protein
VDTKGAAIAPEISNITTAVANWDMRYLDN